MSYTELIGLMRNVAMILLPLFALRFPRLGSLYDGPDPQPIEERILPSSAATPTATQRVPRTLSMAPLTEADTHACGTMRCCSARVERGCIMNRGARRRVDSSQSTR